jgi:putative NIF3 family GTP cyclohydrolase 1 type 2
MIEIKQVVQFLDQFLAIQRFNGSERGGIYRPSNRAIARLGLALEPWPHLPEWVQAEQLDALFLHRPWQLPLEQLAPDIGVISYHLAFDEGLTLGFNPRLAEVLGMENLSVLGEKEGRAIGMLGEISPQSFASYCCCVAEIFGGQDAVQAGVRDEVHRVAVVGAMTDKLVREAAIRGADLYITGQLRQPARKALMETGIGLIVVGHRRSEEWGLRALAQVITERWQQLAVILPSEI